MKRLLAWFLFGTTVGDWLLSLLEHWLGLAISPIETARETGTALLESCALAE